MKRRLLILPCVFALFGCNCFIPVEECEGNRCDRQPDGGTRDGGVFDAGKPDAGTAADAGASSCPVWDGGGVGTCGALTGYLALGTSCEGACVAYPITTAGVFPTLAACVRCGCDPSKFKGMPFDKPLGPTSSCDELRVSTTSPSLLDEALGGPSLDAGCTPTFWNECVLWRGYLGDAGYARACAATLTPGVSRVTCFVYL